MRYRFFFYIVVFLFSCTLLIAQEEMDEYLQNMHGPTTEDYLRLLNEGNHEAKLLAIEMLSKYGSHDDAVLEALILSLGEGTLFVKRRAGQVVNDFWDVRARSAEVLGDMGDPRALPSLHDALLHDPEPIVKCCVAEAIGKIGHHDSVRYLSLAIRNTENIGSNELVILACVRALGEIGDKDGFLPLLEVAQGRYRSTIRVAARKALEKLQWEQ
jgi:HEAT repeat protein